MALFGFGKKKDEEKNIPACACQSDCATFEATEEDANKVKIEDGAMSVKVLGVGCASCHEQYEQAKAAVKSMGLDVEVEYITDLQKVVGYGAMSMPALVVNEKVVAMGKVLKAADVEKLLHKLGVLKGVALMSKEKSAINVFQKYLTVWVILCMVIGILIGEYLPGIPAFLNQFEYAKVSVPMAILIWLMIYPMMMKVDFQSIKNGGKNPKGLFVTWITNWLIKPFKNYYQKLKMRFENESETAEH